MREWAAQLNFSDPLVMPSVCEAHASPLPISDGDLFLVCLGAATLFFLLRLSSTRFRTFTSVRVIVVKSSELKRRFNKRFAINRPQLTLI